MPNVREGTTFVEPYDRPGGVHVKGHKTHYQHGTPVYVVLYREKDVREPGGTREHPINKKARWHMSVQFGSDKTADRARRRLMRRGYTAIVEKIGGRDEMPTLKELVMDAERGDRKRSAMRRE